jgi:hypothetical protein
MCCRGLHGFANPAYLSRFLFPGLLRVARYCAPGGVRVVSTSASYLPSTNPAWVVTPSLSGPSWVGAASYTALLFPCVAQRAQNDRHRSKRQHDASIPLRDTRHHQRERRGKDPVQGSRPYVVAEAHPTQKTRRVVGGQERSALPAAIMLMSAATRLSRRDIQTTEAITLGKATRSIRRCICGEMTRGRRIASCSPCVGFSPYQPRRVAPNMRVLCPERRGIMRGYNHREATTSHIY